MRPGVADGKRKIVAHSLVHADEQTVVNGIPTGLCLEEDTIVGVAETGDSVDVGYAWNNHLRGISVPVCTVRRRDRPARILGVREIEIHVLATSLSLGVVNLDRALGVRLIHVVK